MWLAPTTINEFKKQCVSLLLIPVRGMISDCENLHKSHSQMKLPLFPVLKTAFSLQRIFFSHPFHSLSLFFFFPSPYISFLLFLFFFSSSSPFSSSSFSFSFLFLFTFISPPFLFFFFSSFLFPFLFVFSFSFCRQITVIIGDVQFPSYKSVFLRRTPGMMNILHLSCTRWLHV